MLSEAQVKNVIRPIPCGEGAILVPTTTVEDVLRMKETCLALFKFARTVDTFAKCDCEKDDVDSHWNDVIAALALIRPLL